MFAHIPADDAAVGSAVVRTHALLSGRARALIVIILAFAPAGCMSGVPLAGADPADPAAKTAAIGYRSVVAPYASLRPRAPASWREQNDRVAPPAKSGE